jgi:hypothetical protein
MGLADPPGTSRNPLAQVLELLDERVECKRYSQVGAHGSGFRWLYWQVLDFNVCMSLGLFQLLVLLMHTRFCASCVHMA